LKPGTHRQPQEPSARQRPGHTHADH
jgi:hypothetical protein